MLGIMFRFQGIIIYYYLNIHPHVTRNIFNIQGHFDKDDLYNVTCVCIIFNILSRQKYV